MKINLFVLLFCAFVVLGCANGFTQRFEDFRTPEKSKVAVLKEEFSDSLVVADLEEAFRENGFQVARYVPLDPTLDYLVIFSMGEGSREFGVGELLKIAVVDYKARRIVARMSYKAGHEVPDGLIQYLVDDMLATPSVTPDINTDLN